MNTPSRVATVTLWIPELLSPEMAETATGATKWKVHAFRPPAEPGLRFLVGAARVDLSNPCAAEHLAVFRRPAEPAVHSALEPSLLPTVKNGSSSKEY